MQKAVGEYIQRIYPRQKLKCSVTHLPTKRIFDFLFSLCVLVFGFPIYLLIALVVFLTSGWPVIYSHQRVGRGGEFFRCYKFRTMKRNSEEEFQAILDKNPMLKDEWNQTRKLKNDPRITCVGFFLRKTSLDELPQFFNVLKGDLSVVGPRPVVESELIEYYQIKSDKILSIRPGLTGLWQVSGRNDLGYKKRVLLDEIYVNQRSFQLDLHLILKTVPAMIKSKGAY